MTEILQDYVWETDENELRELINSGYEIIYQDVNLSTIYDEIANCYENHELQEQILKHLLGYYGLCVLVHVDGVYYWLMQL